MTDTPTPAAGSEHTPTEAYESLTGFDGLAIAARFGLKIAEVKPSKDPETFLRMLMFVEHRRAGLKDADAYHEAMIVPLRDVRGFFAPDDDDDDDGDADGEGEGSGEGDAAATP